MAADISAISNSAAFQELDELHRQGKITDTQVQKLKSKYAKMHEAVLTTYEHEKTLLRRGKQLKQQLTADRQKLDSSKSSTGEDASSLDKLREEAKTATEQATMAEEKVSMLALQGDEYTRQKAELEEDIERAKQMRRAEFEPHIKSLEKDVEDLDRTLLEHKESIQKMDVEKTESVQRIQTLSQEIEELDTKKLECAVEKRRVHSEPEKTAKQAEVVINAKKALQRELDRVQDRVHEVTVTIDGQNLAKKELEQKSADLFMQLDQQMALTEDKQRVCDDYKKKLAYRQVEHEDHLSVQVKLELEMKGRLAGVKTELEMLAKRTKEKDAMLRKVKKAEQELRMAEDSIPPVERMIESCVQNLEEVMERQKRQTLEAEEATKDRDQQLYYYLRSEKVDKSENDQYAELQADIKELNEEQVQLVKKERELSKQIAQLSSSRELSSREASKALRQLSHTLEELKVKDIYVEDLQKKKAEVRQKWREYEHMYDVTKNFRNRTVNLIQATSQGLEEWKEKIKILQNEVDILSKESKEKDVKLAKSRLEHAAEITARETSRAEINKQLVEYRRAREEVEQQLVEIDKLNAIINTIERHMLRLKRHYETAVEDRNYTGIQLIDRNDELCILYEKHNIQEQVLTNGELELQAREEDIRRLNLERLEYAREKEIVRKFAPIGPEYEAAIVEVREELLMTRAETVELSNTLEDPGNDRRRDLPGRDPAPQELAGTIKKFEERLNDKKEQMLEKMLVLEEVSSLSDRLRGQAADGREDTLELAKRVNDLQARIRAMTKKMMATVSELSMYQATAMKLQQEKHELELEVQDATWRVEHGQAPSSEAEAEWERMVLEDERRRETRAARAMGVQAAPSDAFVPSQITRTTAEPRPNAYIPDDIGIPKPYGASAPFKPSATGRGLSMMRKPLPVEIEI